VEKKELIEELKDRAPQGKITCTDAHQLADKLNIHPSEVGKACNEANIKICACEVGCF
jgi:ArsR family metal-binding transcriptional regulator